ncbi:putative disease resistance protein RGA3 [Trifolium repens]|nr:putative disease resistance protein RGA3 [Trifolium repens]
MAEAVLELVLHNLRSLIHKEIAVFQDFEQDFKSLASLLTTIKATLEDAEEKQFTNRPIKDWLLKLKDAAHILDDILDECATQALEYGGIKGGRLSNKDKGETLVQLIFNHERVVNHFELRIWVCVSEDFSLKRMTKDIIESACGHACEDLDLDPLQRKLLGLLQGKRYLLVLDDVWDDDQENWQRLRSVLACGGKGASILVTTRLPKVVETMGTVFAYYLSKLSDNDCLKLFKQRAFRPNEKECANLVVIGNDIVKKCCGVPLAAITLGNLLRFKREEKEWLYVKESKLWSLRGENSVMAALRLSYLNLPVKLRQCFALCALFPKDKIISKHILIELWMAHGFISSVEKLEEEDIGNEVWNELYWRSFFQDIQIDEFGKIKSFKMHDLVHDLAQSVAEDVCSITDDNDVPSASDRIRHLSIYKRKSLRDVNSVRLANVKSLKTCLKHVDQLSPHVLKCYSLRVLDLERRTRLSSSIGCLKYLRYLNLSDGKFKTLPKSICKLWNLQILKLDNCYHLLNLPNSLTQLKALQSIYLTNCYSLSSLPSMIRKLTSLKTLTLYIVGKKKGFLLEELGQLNLKGDLYIRHLERVKSVMNAKEANMSSKNFKQLRLSWERDEESNLQENVEEILEVLQPQTQQLQTLGVQGYTGSYFPQWMSSPSLENLTFLQLMDCNSCLHLPLLGKLPTLKDLRILNMSHVIYVDEEPCDGGVARGFTKLAVLVLVELPNLVRLSREDKENMFPCLSRLQITECSKLLGLPCLPYLNDLRIEGKCNQDLVSSIHKLEQIEVGDNETTKKLSCLFLTSL